MGFVVDAVGGFLGGQDQKHAAKNVITTYDTVGRQATGQFENARQAAYDLNSPFYDVGRFGAQGAANMLQPGAQFSTSDPSYNWRLQQGLGAVENSAAANGLLHSGGTMKALNNYAQGAASQEFQNQFNRLNTLGGYGQEAARNLTGANYNSANGISNSLFEMAKGVSGGYGQKADALGSQTGSIGGAVKGLGTLFGVPGF
jgi:hypothetical protein